MRNRRTSRILNDHAYFLGLSYTDISNSGVALLVLLFITKSLGLQNALYALLPTILGLFLLIPVRLNFRRKIIRDSLLYLIRNGVIHVSKNRRNSKLF